MLTLNKIAENLNILGHFCGRRDVAALTQENLSAFCGRKQADAMVLFGGSILCGIDVLAEAIRSQAARQYIIAGGAGHTTATLQEKARSLFPGCKATGETEAELFAALLQHRHGLQADFLETHSTNCGNNITNLLALLSQNHIPADNLILTQDATMQQRMDAVLRKYKPDCCIVNFASYEAHVVVKKDALCFQQDIFGMWSMDRYITLLMGELPRLQDTPSGYGPQGKNYLAHVAIPASVSRAFHELQDIYADKIRKADARFATPAVQKKK